MPSKKHTIILAKANDGTPEILVYGDICGEMANEFATQLKALEKTSSLVNVRINSDGGSVYSGIAMFNCVVHAKCAIDMYIDGLAASMASAFAMAGRKVYMSRFARLMTHKPSGWAGGSAEELRAVAKEIDALEPVLNECYQRKTGLSAQEVTARFLNGKDNYFSADEALTAKLIDGIYDGVTVDAADTKDVRAFYQAFQTKLTASLNINHENQNLNMRQIPLAVWAQICAAMGITDSADDNAVVASIKKYVADANKLTGVQAKLEKAEADVLELKKSVVTKDVQAMLAAALKGQKITAKQNDIFARQFAEDPAGLKEVLDSMGAYVSITEQLQTEAPAGNYTAEVQALMAEGWDKLMENGKMSILKAKSEKAYLELYQAKYGYLPNQKPKIK